MAASNSDDYDAIENRAVYEARRERVYAALGDHAALIVAATPEVVIGRDTETRYLVDPELFYLTGYREPEAVAVLCPGREHRFTLFVRPRDQARERWTGLRGGVDAATARFAADAAHPIDQLPQQLPRMVAGVDTLYARFDSGRPRLEALLKRIWSDGRRLRARTGRGPRTLVDPGVLLDDVRLIKDEHEIAALRTAARISAEAFAEAAALIRPGAGEWVIEAALEAGFRSRGADGFAFPSIVASAANATTLHYVANERVMNAGELVLIDAGARYRMYCGDISRTFPVSGRFTVQQRALYQAVLRAHDAAVAAVQPGRTIQEVHEAARHELITYLETLGLLKLPLDEPIDEAESLKRFVPHKTSHWLGLEVHDVGTYVVNGESRCLEPGMVLTIEPGLYIPADTEGVAPGFAGLGVRIEDDVLVTANGHDVLTAGLPTAPDEVEALIQKG